MKRPIQSTALLTLALAGAIAGVGALSARVQARPAVDHSSSATPASKINSRVLADTAGGRNAPIVIVLTDQADTSAGAKIKDQNAQGWYVYNTLKNKADATQGPLKTLLAAQGRAYQSYWAANILVTTANAAVVQNLAARSDVQAIEPNDAMLGIEPPSIADQSLSPTAPTAVEWGVANVNAPQVWAMGFTGQNIVIGNADTGMQWDHPALKPHYRGWDGTTADHNYNWHDSIHTGGNAACPPNSVMPCDDSQHGTHTTGTTSGDDGAGNQIGVAPGARWIGTRNMDRGNGTPATYTESFQWFIAPTDLSGNNPDPTKRP
ncbi:MAG: S8 family serine peptidase, partial [Chloroflexota bacterium]|nr:S8 family serine peptidase [Chloroflexota bacterium]